MDKTQSDGAVNSVEQRTIDEINNESISVGRISVGEAVANPEIFKDKVEARIQAIIDKYGYKFAVTEFSWVQGQFQAKIDLVKKS